MMYLPPVLLALTGFVVMIRMRQAILLFMGAEIFLSAANWGALLAVQQGGAARPAIMLLFSIPVAAAEATIGLSVVLRLARRYRTTEVRAFETLKDQEG
ncbi:MAG: NADH-quinone oxidoreductase subunit K [Sulfobacillus sp.]|nr:NADH-quinone oxidoreductase subunit K [Sulfobacillus sp.]